MSIIINDWEDMTQKMENPTPVPVVPDSAMVETGNTKSKPSRVSPLLKWCFTYNNPNLSFMDIFMNNYRVKKYVFQLERGNSGTEHFQGVVQFDCKVRPCSVFGDEWNAIHWESCNNWDASIRYCQKKEGRIRGPWLRGVNLIEEINILKFEELYEWQKDIIKIIEGPVNNREINWFWEGKGGVGKSTFCKFLVARYGAMILTGKGQDMKYAIAASGTFPRIVVVDVPRSNKEFLSYTGIEEIKNGCFFCGKYESKQVFGNSPHMIVFSNFEPEYEKLSADRWKIRELP